MSSGLLTADSTQAPETRPSAPDVTLVAVSSISLSGTVEALRKSMREVRFARCLLLSDRLPDNVDLSDIEWRKIPRLTSRDDYSAFMLRELHRHVDTSHVLVVQWDGYVLNGAAWRESFLEYDYIGAPWPHFGDDHRVGNGGFSLRSRRLLEICAGLDSRNGEAEDITICRTNRLLLENRHAMRFAPEHVARLFAYERCPSLGGEFGFHGAFNLVRVVDGNAAVRIFRSLELPVMTRPEHKELLTWSLRERQWRLAWQILRRMMVRRLRTMGGVNARSKKS